MRSRSASRHLTPPAIACVIGVLVLLWSVRRAIVLDPPPALRTAAVSAVELSLARENLDIEVVLAAVDIDPFQPGRQPPDASYRLPIDSGQGPPGSAGTIALPTLLGTVITSGSDSFAMCQLGDGPPRVLRAGQRMGAFVLRTIKQGRAVFVSDDGETHDVTVTTAAAER